MALNDAANDCEEISNWCTCGALSSDRMWCELAQDHDKNASPNESSRAEIGKWLAYYNSERSHSTHGILTPVEAYERKTEPMRMAA